MILNIEKQLQNAFLKMAKWFYVKDDGEIIIVKHCSKVTHHFFIDSRDYMLSVQVHPTYLEYIVKNISSNKYYKNKLPSLNDMLDTDIDTTLNNFVNSFHTKQIIDYFTNGE